MKTKISMKTIYLILVISIGLIGLGIGSTYAVFTASAEISNPISFSSNLSYKADIFDTADITIGPNSSKNVNFAIYNDEQIAGVNYATWYIYDGDSSDIIFEENSSSEIGVSGALDTQGGVIGLHITNNTSNTITLTMGVATSKDEIVLPSYMKLVTITAPITYTLNLNKGTGVSTIYYKINGASSYTSSTSNISLSVNSGSTYYYYGTASTGYSMSSCTSSSPCSGTMGTSAVTKTLSALVNSYTLNLNKGTGVSRIYYKINGASRYTSSTSNKSLSVKYNTTYYYYGTASTGYSMSSCTSSSPCSGTMGTSAVTKTLSALVNSYTLNLNKGTGVSRIYYKINGASRYTSSTSNKSLSVKYNTTYYYYGVASSGYTMSSCTSSSPCSGTMGTSTVTKTLSATATSSGPFTVIITVLGSEETRGTTSNGTFTATGVYNQGLTSISCTNGATATVSGETVTVTNITADTTCNIS